MKKIILFDLAYTLFDDLTFIELKRKKLREIFDLGEEEMAAKDMQAADKVTNERGVFVPEEYARTLAAMLNQPEKSKEITALYSLDPLYRGSIYPEAMNVLPEFARLFRLGIFSGGNPNLKKTALLKSGLKKFFDPRLIFIFTEKIPQIAKINRNYQPFAVLDDHPEVVNAWVKEGVPYIIRLRRGRYVEEKLEGHGANVYEVENLTQALELIKEKTKV